MFLRGFLFPVFFTKCLSKCPSFTNPPPQPWKISVWALALRHYTFYPHLNCFWTRLCLDNCYVLHQTHLEFCHFQHSVFFSGIYRHIHPYWDIIKAYSDLFWHIQHHVHIYNFVISYFEPGSLFKTEWNIDQAYPEPCHWALFSHIHNLVKPLHMQKPSIHRILEYSRKFMNILNSYICKTCHIFRTLLRFRIEIYAKIVKNDNYFPKRFILDLCQGLDTPIFS